MHGLMDLRLDLGMTTPAPATLSCTTPFFIFNASMNPPELISKSKSKSNANVNAGKQTPSYTYPPLSSFEMCALSPYIQDSEAVEYKK